MKIQIEVPEIFFFRMIHLLPDDLNRFNDIDVLGVLNNKTRLKIIHEPTNPVDENAMRVYYHNMPIGYLVREDAMTYKHIYHVLNFLEIDDRILITTTFNGDFNTLKRLGTRHYRDIIVKITKRK